MPNARLYHIDAFAAAPFEGNPAMVCLLGSECEPSERWLQAFAADVNLSETAYVQSLGAGAYRLRWFTPREEVELCGHATLAAAHALCSTGAGSRIGFESAGGLLTVEAGDDGYWMDFPQTPPERLADPGLEQRLCIALGVVGATELCRTPSGDYLLAVGEPEAVQNARPDFRALADIPEHRGVILTAATAAGADFVSRFFAPRLGVDEDPVTGSAHCALAPYWSKRLGRERLIGYQCSARGGTVRCALRSGGRVGLGGRAVTVYVGSVELPRQGQPTEP